MQITIPSTTLSGYNGSGSTATLKILSDQDFRTSDGVNVARNYIRDGVFYQTVSCTVASNVVTIPSYTLDSTTDSSVPNGTYTAILYDANGKRVQAFYSGWRIPTTFGSTPTWDQLSTYNGIVPSPLPLNYITAEQAQVLIDAATGAIDLSSKQDVLVSGTNIKTVNSTSLLGSGNISITGGGYKLSSYASLSAALTDIGSTKAVLDIDSNVTHSATTTVPSTLKLRHAGGLVTKSGSGTITFAGIGLEDPESRDALFSGFSAGDITWSGTSYPTRLSVNLWSGTDVAAKMARATAALSGKKVTLVAFPGSIASGPTVFNDGHSLHLTAGTYTDDWDGGGNATERRFYIGDNSTVYGDGIGRTVYQASSLTGNNFIFSTTGINPSVYPSIDGANQNITFRDFTIYADPAKTNTDNGGLAINFGNCTNFLAENICLQNVCSYGIYAAAFSSAGNHAKNGIIRSCIFDNVRGQNTGTTNGENITVEDCIFTNINLSGTNGNISVIDFEPNTPTDKIENITIANNLIDSRASGQFHNAILVQPAGNNTGTNKVTIVGNTIRGSSNGKLSNGIMCSGGSKYVIANNNVDLAVQAALTLDNIGESMIGPNFFRRCGQSFSTVLVTASADNTFTGNVIDNGVWDGSQRAEYNTSFFTEAELAGMAITTSGATVTRAAGVPYPQDWWQGKTVTINATDYTISSVTDYVTFTLSSSPGTLAAKTAASATDVNTGTDTITSTAHGFNNNCLVRYVAGTAAIAGLTNGNYYYVVNKTANTFQLSATSGGSAIDLTSTGTGTQTFYYGLATKFSNNKYVNNRGRYSLQGTSKVLSAQERAVLPSKTVTLYASQNDYNLSTPEPWVNLWSDGAYNITGITLSGYPYYYDVVDGQSHILYNSGSFNITLKHESASSTATNRFKCSTGADIVLSPGQAAEIIYSTSQSRWVTFKKN